VARTAIAQPFLSEEEQVLRSFLSGSMFDESGQWAFAMRRGQADREFPIYLKTLI